MTRSRARLTAVLAVGLLALSMLATAQSKDPFVGSWRLNPAKSRVQSGPAAEGPTST